MMEILAQLSEFIKSCWEYLKCWYIVNEYEHGVILRFGKYFKTLDAAGFGWKIPFADEILICRNTTTTMAIKNQSLTTLDEHPITIECIVKYKISNPKKFLLEVEDASDAINDITQGKIKELVNGKDWKELILLKDSEIKEAVHKEAKEWGIKIDYITITSLVKARVYKLINNNH